MISCMHIGAIAASVKQAITVTDPYWDNVTLLMHGDTLVDSGPRGVTLTAVGSASISPAVTKFKAGALQFAASGDYFYHTLGSTDYWGLYGDFTLEVWVYPTVRYSSGSNCILHLRSAATNRGVHIHLNTTGLLVCDDGAVGTIASPDAVPLNTWSFITVTRSGNTITTYINGVIQRSYLTTTYSQDFGSATVYTLQIGKYYTMVAPQAVDTFRGYMSELRITKGVARYNSNFTPPTSQFPGGYVT